MRISDWSSDVCSSDLDRFHALGHHLQPQLAGEVEAGLDHCALARLGAGAGNEVLVDLELGERNLRQLRQRGVAGTEIVDRQAETLQPQPRQNAERSEEHTSELQSLMRISFAVF